MDEHWIWWDGLRILEIIKRWVYSENEKKEKEMWTWFKKTMPSPLGSLILSKKKFMMNNFIQEINGFKNINVYYTHTDSLILIKNKGMY